MKPTAWISLFALIASSACSTTFHGSAYVDGPGECQKKCEDWNLEFSSMVMMGSYTSGCVCRVRGKQTSASFDDTAGGAAAAATAGVVIEKRMRDQQNQQMHLGVPL